MRSMSVEPHKILLLKHFGKSANKRELMWFRTVHFVCRIQLFNSQKLFLTGGIHHNLKHKKVSLTFLEPKLLVQFSQTTGIRKK